MLACFFFVRWMLNSCCCLCVVRTLGSVSIGLPYL
jgi:hypothetical protein